MRKTGATTLAILVLMLSHAAIGRAADTIFTPPLIGGSTVGGSGTLLLCQVLNTSASSQQVSVRINNNLGADITQNPIVNSPLSGGGLAFVQASVANPSIIFGYCKVTGDGPPKSLLVSLCNSNRVGATDNCVAVVTGQSQGGGF